MWLPSKFAMQRVGRPAAAAGGGSQVLMHLDGADGSTTFTDESGHTVTASGAVEIDTAQSKFGGASAYFSGGRLLLDGASDLDFGTGDFTVDFWLRQNGFQGQNNVFGWNAGNCVIYVTGGDPFLNYYNSGVAISGAGFSADVWAHIALTRASGTTRLFKNGVKQGSDYADSTNYTAAANEPCIGSNPDGTISLNGWIDEIHIIKGTAAWTANFTPPTVAYTS